MSADWQDRLIHFLKHTRLSRTERIKESNNEIDDNGEVERYIAPQRYMTAQPEQ